MSSASSRPFRHTATVIALAITSGLAEVGAELVKTKAHALRQAEGEQKKQKKNQSRIREIQESAQKTADFEASLKGLVQDWVDTVFVHRYRDVDPRVRTDCVAHLGEWIRIYPDHFFDANYTRYLGWVLSDTSSSTRLEVVKQLQKIYQNEASVPGLSNFTERFRPRLVEMATRDAETGVRVAALDLLELLRKAGVLEPDDIDTISKLIYDTDSRIRKAVVPFFVAGVQESYESKIDDLGGNEALDEGLPSAEEGDYEQPTVTWLKLKSLAELLQTLDPDDDTPATIERGTGLESDTLVAAGTESRCTLAAQALSTKMNELARWEVIAGCLLFDHSNSTAANEAEDIAKQFQQQCLLTEKEEVVLLDVLNTSVKSALTDLTDASAEATGNTKKTAKKLTKTQQQEQLGEREAAAQRLAQLIPRLLKKFGASAEAASAVLRLEHILNLEVFQELRQDSTTYSALLDDINKQFLTHDNRQVLFEASDALRHAKSYEELGEITDGKLQSLWEDTTHALVGLCKGEDVESRGSIDHNVLKKLESTVLRIANLARISDCVETLETPRTSGANKQRRKQQSDAGTVPVDLLVDLVARGRLAAPISQSQSQSQRNRDIDEGEDAVVKNAAQSMMFYFMWRVSRLHAALKSTSTTDADGKSHKLNTAELLALVNRRDAFASNLDIILSSRRGIDDMRTTAAGTLLDLHNMFATLRNFSLPSQSTDDDAEPEEDDSAPSTNPATLITRLTSPISFSRQKVLTRVFAAIERDFAKKASHTVASYSGKDDPEEFYSDDPEDDPEDEDVDSDDDGQVLEDEDEEERRQNRKATMKTRTILVAEERLCMLTSKIVIALRAGVLDVHAGGRDDDDMELDLAAADPPERNKEGGAMYKRVTRNRLSLGPNYKEIIAALEADNLATGKSAGGGGAAKARGAKSKKASGKSAATKAKTSAKSKATTTTTAASSRGKRAKKSKEVISDDEDDIGDEPEDEPDDEEEEPEDEEAQALEEAERQRIEEDNHRQREDAGDAANGDREEGESVLGD
jgi:cohesin complex subunit SA-1/2